MAYTISSSLSTSSSACISVVVDDESIIKERPILFSARVIKTIEEFQSIAELWLGLISCCETPLLPFTHQWLNHYLQSFSHNAPFIIVLEDDKGTLLAALPLQITKTVGLNVLGFLGSKPLVYDQVTWLIDSTFNAAEAFNQFARCIQKNKKYWDVLDFQLLPDNEVDGLFSVFKEALELNGLTVKSNVQDINPVLPLSEDWKEKPPKSKLRGNINYYQNRLKKAYPNQLVQLRFYSSNNETTQILNYFSKSHIDYWEQRQVKSAFKQHPQLIAFYEKMLLLTQNDPTLSVCFTSLNIGNQPMCYELGMIHNQSYLSYIRFYESGFEAYSPGTLHYHYLIRQLLTEERIKTFDFGRGDEGYKFRWTKDVINLYRLTAFSTKKSQLLWQGYYATKDSAKQVKRKLQHISKKLTD